MKVNPEATAIPHPGHLDAHRTNPVCTSRSEGSHSGLRLDAPGDRGGRHIGLKAPQFLPLSLAPRAVVLPGVRPP